MLSLTFCSQNRLNSFWIFFDDVTSIPGNGNSSPDGEELESIDASCSQDCFEARNSIGFELFETRPETHPSSCLHIKNDRNWNCPKNGTELSEKWNRTVRKWIASVQIKWRKHAFIFKLPNCGLFLVYLVLLYKAIFIVKPNALHKAIPLTIPIVIPKTMQKAIPIVGYTYKMPKAIPMAIPITMYKDIPMAIPITMSKDIPMAIPITMSKTIPVTILITEA